MDEIPIKYAIDKTNTNEIIKNRFESNTIFDFKDSSEKERITGRSFLQNNFDILNPPDI